MVVGVRGAGVTTLVKALAPGAEARKSALVDDLGPRPKKGTKRQAPAVFEHDASLGGHAVVLHDVPGDGRSSKEEDFDEASYGLLLEGLDAADVIVHLIDASDPEAERLGGRLERAIYASFHDAHAHVVVALTKADAAKPKVRAALQDAWPGAIPVSAKTGAGLDHLTDAITRVLGTKPIATDATDDTPARSKTRFDGALDETSLVALQLGLVARTRAESFDGAAIAKELAAAVDDGSLSGVVFLREARLALEKKGPVHADNELRFLTRMHDDVWDADVLHLAATSARHAKALCARAKSAWGAAEAAVLEKTIVRARWDMTGLTATPSAHTVQDVHLEIIRRAGYNAFRGDRIAASLRKHRDLFRAVAFGRRRIQFERGTDGLGSTWLNTAFEIGDDQWNADTMWLVAKNEAAADRLRLLADAHWLADDVNVVDAPIATTAAGIEAPARIVELWWD